jgi:hypothetical protein
MKLAPVLLLGQLQYEMAEAKIKGFVYELGGGD